MFHPTRSFLVLALFFVMLGAPVYGAEGPPLWGTWYLSLDVESFGLPPGTFQGGFLSFQAGGTLLVVDAGDFAAAPIGAFDTAQLGSWSVRGRKVRAVGIFLRADGQNGDPQTWVRVHFSLTRESRDRLVGTVRLYELPCDLPGPFALFACPDPVAGIDDFVQTPPFDVPVQLSRLSMRLPQP